MFRRRARCSEGVDRARGHVHGVLRGYRRTQSRRYEHGQLLRVLVPQDDALDRRVGVLGLCIGRRAHHVFAVPSDASISAPSTRRLRDGAAMPVPHHSIDGVIYEPAHPTVDLHAGGG